ncbi:MAG TPA: glycoside hydrolase family 2 protein [Steroidobacteraceae bacterium]|nr:glycoside hydrolase family 2 protein [Steroidobacteraceae bacterium]
MTGWHVRAVEPGSITDPAKLPGSGWTGAADTGTAAAMLRAAGNWTLDGPARRFDADDWWFKARFPAPRAGEVMLGFDGLATLASVWLNGEPLLDSDNMFVSHAARIDARLRDDNEIVIRCRSLDAALSAKRPRPRWRVPMLENQQLRWFRTTLLGRTPGWSPPAAPVGPWRPVWLETRDEFSLTALTVDAKVEESSGLVEVDVTLAPLGATRVRAVTLRVSRGEVVVERELAAGRESGRFSGRVTIPDVERWWPHTHGEPALYDAQLLVRVDGGADARAVPLRRLGFRTIDVSTADEFRVRVNDVPVFCRGACWTPLDAVSLGASRAATFAAVAQAREAGMNLLRVGGTMVYESDDFLDACDELGILLWQEFMFASMDYPGDDASFADSVRTEAVQQLARLGARPSLAVICGNSEVEQQAAMWGAGRESWSPALFHQLLAALVAEHSPRTFYWPSSAHGGAFPHQANAGTTSYYGVGAYLRPPEDARRSELRFATECLAFANVPDDVTLAKVPTDGTLRSHGAAWKTRSPRDLGAGWDFDDVRDFYLAKTFGVNPVELRYSDHARYLELSRAASGEVMAAAFAEWRRQRSTCGGALVWFLRDLWPGAGWGVVDSTGRPKAAWHYLRRAFRPVTVSISDEGLNGLVIQAANDTAQPIDATLELVLFRNGQTVVNRDRAALLLPARGALERSAGELFPGFVDTAYAHRFGPPPHDLAVASLRDAAGTTLAESFHLVGGHARPRESDLGLSARAAARGDDTFALTVQTARFAQAVRVEVEGFVADDDCFHLAPGASRTLTLRPDAHAGPVPRGTLHALNALNATRIQVDA